MLGSFPFDAMDSNLEGSLQEQRVNATLEAFMKAQSEKRLSMHNQVAKVVKRIKSIEEQLEKSQARVSNLSDDTIHALGQQVSSFDKRIQAHDETSIKKDEILKIAEQVSSLERANKKRKGETQNENNDETLDAIRAQMALLEQAIEAHEGVSVNSTDMSALRESISSVEQKIKSAHNISNDTELCVPWTTNMDDWWTHHPDWFISKDNSTHQCFSPMTLPEKAEFFRQLYDIQYNGDCSNLVTKRTINSGYGADLKNVMDGLQYAMETKRPMQIYTPRYWKYAHVPPDNSACPRKDMFCYFLNISKCEPNTTSFERKPLSQSIPFYTIPGAWFYEYATRQQTWLRREVYEFSSKINITSPCTVCHVRRADIVLHDKESRRYHEIDEYVNAMSKNTKNIFLVTDDDNAIGEALTKFPTKKWIYVERPRHKGAEGGFENQTPSKDPKFEVIVLLSIFRLVKKCSTLIHTKSGFAALLRREMGARAHRVNIESGPRVFHPENALTVNISKPYPIP